MPHNPRLIALLTDFGDRDWYVAAMKAVIARYSPDTRTIDITHKIEEGNIKSASFVLAQCYKDFPKGTVFLCVVDPGVGSDRSPVILYSGDYYFVAPDNGLLDLIKPNLFRQFEIDPDRLSLRTKVSSTFHGRDLFAPAAALLSRGLTPGELGNPSPFSERAPFEFPVVQDLPCHGTVVYFDHFGNAISNLRLNKMSPKPRAIELSDNLRIPFANTFSDVPESEPVAYLGSCDLIEIAVNRGSARLALNLENQTDFRLV